MIDVPQAVLVDAMACASISYWGVKRALRSGWQIEVSMMSAWLPTFYDVSMVDLARGASLLALRAPVHFGHLIAGRADADTGDLLIQLTIFSDLKYG